MTNCVLIITVILPFLMVVCRATIPNLAMRDHIILQHNLYRANVDPPSDAMMKLAWDNTLAAAANRLITPATCNSFVPRNKLSTQLSTPNPGQNFFAYGGGPISWTNVIKNWHVRAVATYEYGGEVDDTLIDNVQYAQLVNSRTTRVGCASGYCFGKRWRIYACNYSPALEMGNLARPYKSANEQSCAGCAAGAVCDATGPYAGRLLTACEGNVPLV